jgi:uncharacterized membrane protein
VIRRGRRNQAVALDTPRSPSQPGQPAPESDAASTPQGAAESPRPASGLYWVLLAAVVVMLGVALRIGCARGDLWLDEIWSLYFAEKAQTLLGIFTNVHHDNNHYLNTAWLMLVGDAQPLLVRSLALTAGAVTLILVLLRGRRQSSLQMVTATALFAVSPILIQFDSEARGYAPMVCFAVAAFWALESWPQRPTVPTALCFALCCVGGLLSNLTFVFALAGFGAWILLDLWRRNRPLRQDFPILLAILLPILLLVALWCVDLRHLVTGGGRDLERV